MKSAPARSPRGRTPSAPPATASAAPVRIYVLWHPDFAAGEAIAYEIYRWFRLETMEGIPVFFRSRPELGQDQPLAVPTDCGINYVLPLAEAHMVADPVWRLYVLGLLARPDVRMFPVALDPLAFQMPARLRGLNFIRHDVTSTPPPAVEVLLSQLTECLCRDLRGDETQTSSPRPDGRSMAAGKIKLFLSHAKADGTDVPVRLKEFIQTHTQCETFFDETDIASGARFGEILETAITDESAGMIAIQGDHYAERPWCRREIRRFQKPRREKDSAGGETATSAPAEAYFVPPLVVVENLGGRQIARTIPELGQAPCLRWTPGCERRVVSTLLREILLGLFYRRLAREARARSGAEVAVLNRAPDPVLTQHLLVARAGAATTREVWYPGYGLSQLEKDGLKEAFPHLHFRSLCEEGGDPGDLARLGGRVLRLGIGNATDILAGGLSDDHNRELLMRLLRPLCRHRVSLLYGGALPRPGSEPRVNFTEACLHLLLSERTSEPSEHEVPARLYSVPAWPDTDGVTARTVAEWTDVCSFHRVLPGEAGVAVPRPLPTFHSPDPMEYPTPAERRALLERHESELREIELERSLARARCLSFMRRQCCRELRFPVADRTADRPQDEVVRVFAHLFLGGRLGKVSGIAPGLFEEIHYALEARQPVFVLGAGYGATGAIARWLLDPPARRPAELTAAYYLQDPAFARMYRRFQSPTQTEARRLTRASRTASLAEILDGLWERVRAARGAGGLARVLNNTLTHEENRLLLAVDTGYGELCRLVWTGLARLGGP